MGVEQQVLSDEGSVRVNDVQFEGSLDNSDELLSQTFTQTQQKAPVSFDILHKEVMELCAIAKNNQSEADFVLNSFHEGRVSLLATQCYGTCFSAVLAA